MTINLSRYLKLLNAYGKGQGVSLKEVEEIVAMSLAIGTAVYGDLMKNVEMSEESKVTSLFELCQELTSELFRTAGFKTVSVKSSIQEMTCKDEPVIDKAGNC